MDITIANKLFDSGVLSDMYKAGWITDQFFTDREIYLFVDLQKKTKNLSKYKACLEASIKFGRDVSTIYRRLKVFEG